MWYISNLFEEAFVKQSIMAFDHAFITMFPFAEYYLLHSTKDFILKLKNHLLLKETMDAWTNRVKDESLSIELYALQRQLNFIDKTTELSNEIMPLYCGNFLLKKNVILNSTNIVKLIEDLIKELMDLRKENSDLLGWLTTFKDSLIPLAGQKFGTFSQLSGLMKDFLSSSQLGGRPDQVMNRVEVFWSKHVQPKFLSRVQIMGNILFRISFGYILIVSFNDAMDKNWIKITEYLKDAVGFITDASSSFKAGDKLLTNASSRFFGLVLKTISRVVFKYTIKETTLVAIKSAFGASFSDFVATRLTPVLFFIGAGVSVYDAINSANENNWGAFAMDASSAVLQGGGIIAIPLISYFYGASWAGLAGIAIGLAVFTLMFIKKWKFKADQISAIESYLKTLLEPPKS